MSNADMQEEQRLTLEGYINAHASVDIRPDPTLRERLAIVLCLVLIFAAFALAGTNDRMEEERLSLQGYIAERSLQAGFSDPTNCP